jgi:hypothetical protein
MNEGDRVALTVWLSVAGALVLWAVGWRVVCGIHEWSLRRRARHRLRTLEQEYKKKQGEAEKLNNKKESLEK